MKLVISIVLLALGILFLAEVFGVDVRIGHFLLGDPIGKFVTGTTLILTVMLYWLTSINGGAKEQFLSFENEGGAVNIRIKAVNEFLRRLADEFADIVDLRADVTAAHDGRVEAQLYLDVKSGTKIQQLSQVLQQRVRESMREGMGISEIASVKVNVNEIVQADKEEKKETNVRAADWQDPAV